MANEYFKKFPTYQIEGDFPGITRDLFLRFKIADLVIRSGQAGVFYPYRWRDVDRPDSLAAKYYGDSNLYWIIFYSNNSFDYILDFPKTSRHFDEYIIKRYGSIQRANQLTAFYRQTSTKFVIDYDTYLTLEADDREQVSIYQDEFERNEDKRKIKLLSKAVVRDVVNDFDQKIRQAVNEMV